MTASVLWHILFCCWVLSEVFIAIAMRTRNRAEARDRGTQTILWIVIALSISTAEAIRGTSFSMFGRVHWLILLAIVVIIAGLAIRWIAIISLGKSFSANVAIRGSQTIYKQGLYRWVRHPSYLGLELIFLAIALHSRNWISFVVVLIPTTMALLYRIHVEEFASNRAFGPEYTEYSRNTRRLIPWLY
jgi:protein-S-isoprenylcysteine O-methyltransferase Ste14